MPIAEKKLEKIFYRLEAECKENLRKGLSEFLSFEEVLEMSDIFERNISLRKEERLKENYSQGYYFSTGLIK